MHNCYNPAVRRLTRLTVVFGLIWLGLTLDAPCAPAAGFERSIRVETARSTTPNGKPAVALIVNGEKVAQLAKDQRSRTPLRNISVAAALIAGAYRSQQADLSVKATDNSGRRYALFLNGRVLLVATDMEGKAWGATPQELAHTWRDNLLRAWDLEPPAPEDEPRAPERAPDADAAGTLETTSGSAAAGGTLALPTSSLRADPSLANLTISGGHRVYSPPGHTQLGSTAVPAPLTAQVTGRSVGQDTIRHSVEHALRSDGGLKAGQILHFNITSPGNGALSVPAGQQRQLSVEYTTGGPSRTARVLLENTALALPRESATYFSNVPEQLRHAQLLYSAQLPPREAGRLVFHHQNQSGGRLTVVARVLNGGTEPAAVHVIDGTCEPDINTFFVGFKSAEVFWTNLNSGSGYVLRLPAGGQAYLTAQALSPGYTASGYFKVSNLSDSALRLETLALSDGEVASVAPLQDGNGSSNGIFPAPYITDTASYQCGDPWLYLRLGEQDPLSDDGQRILNGCYGMTHSFSVELHNARAWPALVFVVLRASAGEVKGQFFIDDEYVATPLVASGDEQLLKEIPLRPGETKLLKVRAIPLNGGFYPASLILRETRYP